MQKSKLPSTGVIIGRFQTPKLTEGHCWLIDQVASKHEHVVIIIGNHRTQPTARNPLSYQVRERMLYNHVLTGDVGKTRIMVTQVGDHYSDEMWSQSIDTYLSTATNDAVLYGSRDSFVKYYKGKYPVMELESPHIKCNASERRAWAAKSIIDEPSFRAGIIHGIANRHPSPYLAVDVAMIRTVNGGAAIQAGAMRGVTTLTKELLVGRKSGEPFYRFIGGFVDSTDESIRAAAYRELKEEAGDIEAADWELIGEAKIDDWRYRKDPEKIFTCLFTCKYLFGRVAASDDIAEVTWIPVHQIANTQFMPSHQPLVTILLKHLAINSK